MKFLRDVDFQELLWFDIIYGSIFIWGRLFWLIINYKCVYLSEPISDWPTFNQSKAKNYPIGWMAETFSLNGVVLMALCYHSYETKKSFPRSARPFYSYNPFPNKILPLQNHILEANLIHLWESNLILHFFGPNLGSHVKSPILSPPKSWHVPVVFSCPITNVFSIDLCIYNFKK